jgi:hypothetical protein
MAKYFCVTNEYEPVHAPPSCSAWVCGCGDVGIGSPQCVHVDSTTTMSTFKKSAPVQRIE